MTDTPTVPTGGEPQWKPGAIRFVAGEQVNMPEPLRLELTVLYDERGNEHSVYDVCADDCKDAPEVLWTIAKVAEGLNRLQLRAQAGDAPTREDLWNAIIEYGVACMAFPTISIDDDEKRVIALLDRLYPTLERPTGEQGKDGRE